MIKNLDIKKLFLNMVKIRILEESISKNYQKQNMRCPIHLSIGQEAVAVGICQNLNNKDQIITNHRCHAHYLAKGGSVKNMIAELYGNAKGCSGGRGGSMHLFDVKKGVLTSVPIVSSSIPVGVGAGLYFKYLNQKNISVIFLGDAAIEEGVFYESLNYAKILSLPVLFVCENNFYSCFTNINERQPKNLLKNIAKTFDIKTHFLDGNNVLNIFQKSKKIINEIKFNQKPQFIVLETYRIHEHCGPSIDDNLNYRNKKQLNYWIKKCPVLFLERIILRKKIMSFKEITKFKKEYQNRINNIFLFFENNRKLNMKLHKIKIYA